MEIRKPTIESHGPAANHDMPCCVLFAQSEPAVLNMADGVFEPSWKAQMMGYRLIKTDTWLKRVLYKKFFKTW